MAEENEQHEDEQQDAGAKSDELGEAGKRALQAERKARTAAERELKELRAKVQEIEDKDKSEVERLQGQVADLTKQAEAAQAKADRFEVAAAKGLTLAQARRLVGSTKEELEEDADAMRSELGLDKEEEEQDEGEGQSDEDTPQDERPLGLPQENLRDGAAPAGEQEPDPGKLAETILKSPY